MVFSGGIILVWYFFNYAPLLLHIIWHCNIVTNMEDVELDSVEEWDRVEAMRPARRCAGFRWCAIFFFLMAVFIAMVIAIIVLYPQSPDGREQRQLDYTERMLDYMNQSVDPCSDFYMYSCGGYIAQTQLGETQTRESLSFGQLDAHNTEKVKEIIENDWPYLASGYRLCNDLDALDDSGVAPIAGYYNTLSKASSKAILFKDLGQLARAGLDLGVGFSLYIGVDDHDPLSYLLGVYQSGLALPDRSYYLEDTSYYRDWMKQLFDTSDLTELSDSEVDALLELETRIASLMYSSVENRDPERVYNLRTVAELRTLLGEAGDYFQLLSFDAEQTVNAVQIGYLQAFADAVQNTTLAELRQFAVYRLFLSTFSGLGEAQRGVMDTLKRLVYGVSPASRESACVSITRNLFPMLVGKYYAEQANNETKPLAEQMLDLVSDSYTHLIESASWMDDDTRDYALFKLNHIKHQVGFPDEWPEFDELYANLDYTSYFGLMRTHAMRQFELDTRKLNGPVDQDEWFMGVAEVNAYYSPNSNHIVFPLGILAPPFFSPDAPEAVNFGGFGAVAGHELSHAYDDSGSQFDAYGYYRDWWSENTREQFEQRVDCIEKQFSQYEILDGVYDNGNLTAGENIADYGGLRAADLAYQEWQTQHGEDVKKRFGMSADELFFVSFAQVWCEVIRPEYSISAASSDPHSPGKLRVRGTLSAYPRFAETFGCKENTEYSGLGDCDLW